jgi:hypothetical protein
MGKKVAILQSNYIPWKGYFDIINLVDEFIVFDDVQYTRRDWRNRNRIKTANGSVWLTIPVEVKGKYFQAINETRINDKDWNKKHWKTIAQHYGKATFFKQYKDLFEDLYLGTNEFFLSLVNIHFIKAVCKILGITTRISNSSDYKIIEGKTERLVDLCRKTNATEYLSGPAAKDYIDEDLFDQENIRLSWMDYSGYPEYEQLYPPFDHAVSIIDLILNTGPQATLYMNSFSAKGDMFKNPLPSKGCCAIPALQGKIS